MLSGLSPKVRAEGFFEVFLPGSPLIEQRAIVAHIAKETEKLDELRVATERTTVLLNERRAALIATVITDRIDKRFAHDTGGGQA